MILLLAPEKLLISSTLAAWKNSLPANVTLFTSRGDDAYRQLISSWVPTVFQQVEFFSDYANNDLIELRALQLHRQTAITTIIPMSEADILRAARLREALNIPGQRVENARLFRDKTLMKAHAQAKGVAVPRFTIIKDTLDLLNFIDEVNYPVVIKPIMGRGSLNTFLIRNAEELEQKLNSGFISNTSRYTDLLAEEYIDGDVYHIDGLQTEQTLRVLSVSKYVNNCLDFVNGAYLGSYTLEDQNPLNTKILNFCHDLIGRVFALPKNALMHIEVFVDRNQTIWLCEIACRIGGNGINDEVQLRHNMDIKLSYIQAECGRAFEPQPLLATKPVAGRLLIPPKDGLLLAIPETCLDESVLRYQSRGVIGENYQKMQMSNNEIANFLLVADNETAVEQKITELAAWFYQNSQWQALESGA